MNLLSSACGCVALLAATFCPVFTSAQCLPPSSFGLISPTSSTSLTLDWQQVPQADSYEIRYWPNANPEDKIRLEGVSNPSFVLRGLQKNTFYILEIRSKCGQSFSDWSGTIQRKTYNSSGSCSGPQNVTLSSGTDHLTLNWTSLYSHGIRYRRVNSSEWIIPAGGMAYFSPPFTIGGLSPGTYEVALQRNCSGTASAAVILTATIASTCPIPPSPPVVANITDASVTLPALQGVVGYDLYYRPENTATWILADTDVLPGTVLLNAVLLPETAYMLRIEAICADGNRNFSLPTAFTTLPQVVPPSGNCLANKDAGKNMSLADLAVVRQQLNKPSQHTYRKIIGVNDGGLVFRSYQGQAWNQITQLCTQFRNFHTMDEDYNPSLQSYHQNIKPKNTSPEGTPGNIWYNKSLYTQYRQHGFLSITSSTEILQYHPQSWKEKIYQEDDWSAMGAAGIRASYGNYTRHFIEAFAPANASGLSLLAANYQVGNELWDYPDPSDYHNLLYGAWDAFLEKYGPKSSGNWKMGLIAGAFQAFRDNNCNSHLRNFSNCGGNLERHDFIGDYLNIQECQLLKDLDAIDCHPYSFKHKSLNWTFPEDSESEGMQIQHLAAWLLANQNTQTGILQNTQLWASEYGFDSNPVTGVGEKTHSAFLLRGLLLHSRFHFEKVFFYNAFDVARPTDQYYNGLYNSAGFWRLGTHPANNAWSSPLEAHGATPKPAWFGMLDFKARLGDLVFFKALVEQDEAYVYLLAKSDSTEPYLVFWSPTATSDANLNQEISLQIPLDWSNLLPVGYQVADEKAQVFSENSEEGEQFDALENAVCGSVTIHSIRRNPAFIPLITCSGNRPVNEERTNHVPQNNDSPANWHLFPNPGRESIQIQYQGTTQTQVIVNIMASTGQKVLTQTFNQLKDQQQFRLDTSHLSDGIYFVCFQTKGSVIWKKWEKG